MRPLMRSGERFFSRRAAVLVKLRACSMDRILKQPDHGRHGAVRPVGVMGEDGCLRYKSESAALGKSVEISFKLD